MPGDTCAVFGYGSCKRTKGIRIWKFPSAKDTAHKKWRKDWLSEITRTREVDQELRKRIENDKVFTCEKHFDPEDIKICKQFYYNLCFEAVISRGKILMFLCLYLSSYLVLFLVAAIIFPSIRNPCFLSAFNFILVCSHL